MQIGGDISESKCDKCNSFMVWQEFVDHNHQDQSQLEEVCEECQSSCTDCGTYKNSDEIYGGMYLFNKEDTDGEITPKLYSSDDFLCMPCINKKEKQKKEECEKHRFMCDNCGNGFKRDEVVVTDDSSLCKTLCN